MEDSFPQFQLDPDTLAVAVNQIKNGSLVSSKAYLNKEDFKDSKLTDDVIVNTLLKIATELKTKGKELDDYTLVSFIGYDGTITDEIEYYNQGDPHTKN